MKVLMPDINIRKIIYTIRHKYLTFNNVVIAAAFLIAAGWVWGSLEVMQRNYALQKEVDIKERQLQLTKLQRDGLELQKKYYQTDEYRELAVRDTLGLVRPGEKLLILPENSTEAKAADAPVQRTVVSQEAVPNLQQWLNFLFGGNSKSIDTSADTE
jgi:cell division protein FtsB